VLYSPCPSVARGPPAVREFNALSCPDYLGGRLPFPKVDDGGSERHTLASSTIPASFRPPRVNEGTVNEMPVPQRSTLKHTECQSSSRLFFHDHPLRPLQHTPFTLGSDLVPKTARVSVVSFFPFLRSLCFPPAVPMAERPCHTSCADKVDLASSCD